MSSINKGIGKVEVSLKWDPSPTGAPATDLDIIAATYPADDPYGQPAYLVHFDSRSPDGTITLTRESRTGQGFGADEVMTLEFDRLAETYTRVVIGVVIQQRTGRKTFEEVPHTHIRIAEGYDPLLTSDFTEVPKFTAATIAEFTRGQAGEWLIRQAIRGFDADPNAFAQLMGQKVT